MTRGRWAGFGTVLDEEIPATIHPDSDVIPYHERRRRMLAKQKEANDARAWPRRLARNIAKAARETLAKASR